jgi:uncharacterized repeat protein (TIGR03806 family)
LPLLARRLSALILITTLGDACTGDIAPTACPTCGPATSGAGGKGASDGIEPSQSSDPVQPLPAMQTCRAVAPPDDLVVVKPAFPHLSALTEPVALAHPTGDRHWYVIERAGRVRRFDDDPNAAALTDVIDLTAEVETQGDGGLVGIAFHPQFAQNGKIFLSLGAKGGTVERSKIISLVSPDGGATFPPESRRVIFDFDQDNPWRIHLNGDIQFGPDGFLYVGFGDGDAMGDPARRAQDFNDYRGKILRVDVDHGDPYAIPPDNPFVGQPAMPELFALGFRNPWRFTFDRKTGTLWVGDVGAYSWEEVDQVAAGGNMGWPVHEGNSCLGGPPCQSAGFVAPVLDYAHEGQASAVVGGFVYHGGAIPSLAGRYVLGDFGRGDVWALRTDNTRELLAHTGRRLVSFAEQPDGELLISDLSMGEILRIEPAPPSQDLVAERLSGTGCFLAADPQKPAPGLVPYEVRVSFWSDGAEKHRYVSVPPGEQLTVRDDGHIVLPVGSVLAKQFYLDQRPIETRLMMKYRDGQWAGYTYAWNADGRDATLVPEDGLIAPVGGDAAWSFPSRTNCLGCHNQDRALGLELAQLDFEWTPVMGVHGPDSLTELQQAGLLPAQVPNIRRLPHIDGKAPLEQRARAYLHANCSMCHTPDGPTPVNLDLRFTTALVDTHLCGVQPTEGDLGATGAARLTPGDPSRSIVSLRLHAHGRVHLPPIGAQLIDDKGAAHVDSWIRGLVACP